VSLTFRACWPARSAPGRLQDLGAEVIKIEPPSPDVSRFAFPSTDGMSGYYAQQNAGKRNVSINLNIPGAYELVLKLCDTADIVVENFRAGTLGFFRARLRDPVETQSAIDLRLDHRLWAGVARGGAGWLTRRQCRPRPGSPKTAFVTMAVR